MSGVQSLCPTNGKDREGHQFLFEAISFHVTPSYYNKWPSHGHFAADVELGVISQWFNLP